jgi:hypothetical protein
MEERSSQRAALPGSPLSREPHLGAEVALTPEEQREVWEQFQARIEEGVHSDMAQEELWQASARKLAEKKRLQARHAWSHCHMQQARRWEQTAAERIRYHRSMAEKMLTC